MGPVRQSTHHGQTHKSISDQWLTQDTFNAMNTRKTISSQNISLKITAKGAGADTEWIFQANNFL